MGLIGLLALVFGFHGYSMALRGTQGDHSVYSIIYWTLQLFTGQEGFAKNPITKYSILIIIVTGNKQFFLRPRVAHLMKMLVESGMAQNDPGIPEQYDWFWGWRRNNQQTFHGLF